MRKVKIILVSGTRPNFMKIAPLLKEISKNYGFTSLFVHTGQYYDYEMAETFFHDFMIPAPKYFLNARNGTQCRQIAKIMARFEDVCIREKPNLVIVVGDVNSTLACPIVAKKLGIEVAHIEAGLRSFDITMPEEINRIITDRITDYFFISEPSGYKNLLNEGKDRKRLFFVGNVMIDTLFYGLRELKKWIQLFFKQIDLNRN